jgi:hypothetical protein
MLRPALGPYLISETGSNQAKVGTMAVQASSQET